MNTRTAIALLIAVTSGALLFGQNRDKNAKTLEERVSELEARVTTLEAKFSKSGPEVVVTEKWRDLSLWRRKLTKGMSKDDVIALFGEPDKVDVIGGVADMWFYPSRAFITFRTTGLVDSWSEPVLK